MRGQTFDIIVADPPWRFASNSDAKPGRNPRRHYPTLQLPDIMAWPVPAAREAVLFLWTTAPHLEQAFRVIDAWDFTYKSNLVWDKGKIGTGYWVRGRHEHVLIARRGKFPAPAPEHRIPSVLNAPRQAHSQKPEALQDWIDKTWPDARKLEIFARRRRAGWAVVGNELDRYPEHAP